MKIQFEGIDPDEHRKLQDRVKGLDESDIYDKQGIEALVTRRTESMKAEHERQVQGKEGGCAARTQATDFERRWRQDRIKTALLAAVSGSGPTKSRRGWRHARVGGLYRPGRRRPRHCQGS